MIKNNKLCHIYDMELFNISDFDKLLHKILKQTRNILNCEGGSIYIKDEDSLCFNVFQNDTLSYEEIYKQYRALKNFKLSLNDKEKYLAVESFLTNKIIIVNHLDKCKDEDFIGIKEYDKKYNYKTYSIITAPIIHPLENKTIGVIQLINKIKNGKNLNFTKKDKETISMASSLAALSIEKAQNDIEKLKELNEELIVLNKKLEKKVDIEHEENEKKSAIIFHQSKLISMGEMIGNIAHQWRQPLSAISTIASFLSYNIEENKYNKEDAIKSLEQIMINTKHLSQTIDDFRNFYKTDKIKNEFNFSKNILQTILIVDVALQENKINIIYNLNKDILLLAYENELKQAILNIIENAKDALIEIEDNRFIFIDLYKENEKVILKIKDNAGGVLETNIDKIFEQSFTTKFEKSGTGIGLYMTKKIIEKTGNARINVENIEFNYANKDYKGAVFTLEFSC